MPEGISALFHGFWGEHLVAFWPISCILGRICKRFGRSDGFWTEFGRISVISHGFGWNIWKHFCPSQGRGGRLECNLCDPMDFRGGLQTFWAISWVFWGIFESILVNPADLGAGLKAFLCYFVDLGEYLGNLGDFGKGLKAFWGHLMDFWGYLKDLLHHFMDFQVELANILG